MKFKSLLLAALTVMALTSTAFAQYPPPQYQPPPYPPYPNPAYTDPRHVEVRGTVAALNGELVTVASPQGMFTFIIDHNVTYHELRYLVLGGLVHINGHIRNNGQLMADGIHRH